MTGMRALLLCGPVAMAAVACGAGDGAQAQGIADFMGQSVCLSPAGDVLPGATPLDAACTMRRKLRVGEAPPYTLSNYDPAPAPCPSSQGAVAAVALPVALGGATRIAGLRRHATPSGCAGHVADPVDASVEWQDAGYGFIMASGSPVALSAFDSPDLCIAAPASSARYSRGWVIGPAVLPAPGNGGYVSLDGVASVAPPYGACPNAVHHGLTTWWRGVAHYTGGAALDSLMSEHWSHADTAGVSPGDAQSMERTYWTAELGLTRWEKWERTDDAAYVAAQAARLASGGSCAAPAVQPASPAPGMQVSSSTSAFAFTLRDPRTGQQHGWSMMLCADYTNLVRHAPPAALLAVPEAYDAFWRP